MKEVDRIQITVLVDNYSDLLRNDNSSVVSRPSLPYKEILFAEHGLSLFITVWTDGKPSSVLMDAGASEISLKHNASLLDIPIDTLSAVIISHGHDDHTGSLKLLLQESARPLPVYLHPGCFARRQKRIPGHCHIWMDPVDIDALEMAGAEFFLTPGVRWLLQDQIMITGEVERNTTFERINPVYYVENSGKWIPDLFIDDQAVVICLKRKGLVVITGCAHAGIINTIHYAKKVTGIDRVYAVIGGFHLSGSFFTPGIAPTIAAMKKIEPQYLIPMHCTGWEAINGFISEMPDQVLLNTVGTMYLFGDCG